MATGGSFLKLPVYSGARPATRPVRGGRPASEKSELGCSGREEPRIRERAFPLSLRSPLAFRARRRDRTWTADEKEGLGSLASPLPGIYGLRPEPRGQSPGTKPRGSRTTPPDYKTVRSTTPPKLVTMWGLLIWTLLALHQIRATGAQGMDGHPHGGLWRGLRRGHSGHTVPSWTRGLAWAELSPGSFKIPPFSLGALFRGVGPSF